MLFRALMPLLALVSGAVSAAPLGRIGLSCVVTQFDGHKNTPGGTRTFFIDGTRRQYCENSCSMSFPIRSFSDDVIQLKNPDFKPNGMAVRPAYDGEEFSLTIYRRTSSFVSTTRVGNSLNMGSGACKIIPYRSAPQQKF